MALTDHADNLTIATKELIELSHELAKAEADLAKVEGRIDFETAFNPELKNDQQRKAARLDMTLRDGEFCELARVVRNLAQQRDFAVLKRDQMEREFSIAKLQERRAIAEISQGLRI